MNVEEFAEQQLIDKVNAALEEMWDKLGWPKDYRYHRLMNELCDRLVVSRV